MQDERILIKSEIHKTVHRIVDSSRARQGNTMGFLQNIRDRKNTVRVYNQLRVVTALGPFLVLIDIVGLLGFPTTSARGIERIIADIMFIALGLLLFYLRLTTFREKRTHNKNRL